MAELKNQECPVCGKKSLTLKEIKEDIPHFGEVYILTMNCEECDYHVADVEAAREKEPVKVSFEVSEDNDLNVKVVKSGQATVKIPYVTTIEPGPASSGYITTVEGLINRVKAVIESTEESEEDKGAKKKARKLIKKLNKVLVGREKLKIIIEDPSGNSDIISEKAKKSKL